jgi:phosphoserine phosphatase
LDKTIVSSNCSFAFYKHLVSRKVLPRSSLFYAFLYYIRHTVFGMGLGVLHSHAFSLLRGLSLEVIETEVDLFLEGYLEAHLYPPVLGQLKLAQHLGDYTLILSNSPSFLVKRIAARLSVNGYKSTEYAVDIRGNLCHIAFVMQGEDKASIARAVASQLGIVKQDITAYSDSVLDAPLLLCAGVAIAVNPDRLLRRLSETHCWPIL